LVVGKPDSKYAKLNTKLSRHRQKFESRKYLATEEKITHLQKVKNSAPDFSKGELTARDDKEDKDDTEDRARKDKKIDDTNYKFDTTVTNRR
jgi:hypothetical protein